MLQNQPETAVPRLQPITHREGSATLAPALQVPMSSCQAANCTSMDAHYCVHTSCLPCQDSCLDPGFPVIRVADHSCKRLVQKDHAVCSSPVALLRGRGESYIAVQDSG